MIVRYLQCVLLGFLLVVGVVIHQDLQKNNSLLMRANQYTQTILVQNKVTQFYDNNDPYSYLRVSIDKQEKLYKGYGGIYTFDQINKYLGFFEDLGGLVTRGVMSVEDVDFNFGYIIMEAYEYPEMQRYIADVRKNGGENTAFRCFEQLAIQLEALRGKENFLRILRNSYNNHT